jgi:GNAT superfamily N-acetyltransferase
VAVGVNAPGDVPDRTDVAGFSGHAELAIGRERFDDPDTRVLVAAMMADIEERYAADGPGGGDAPEVVSRWALHAEQVTPPRGAFLVARLAGEPVGCGGVRRVPGAPADVAEIKRMYTVPAVRGRGISRVLLTALEHEAEALGFRLLQLETGLRQPEAVRLYESAGYHRIPDYGQYAGDELTLCFAKDLRGR